MRWHGERRTDDDTLRHLADGEAWKSFDRSYPDFAADVRNVRLCLASDGFNPHGNMSLSHSTWPVIVVSYNLPLWMCMKKEFSMMSLLILGPKSPGKCLDVYLEPLIDDLLELWDEVLTFDRHTRTSFVMRGIALFTISNFPGYGMISLQAIKGYKVCPVCFNEVHSVWCAGKVCYMGHRRWLPAGHPWRFEYLAFDKIVELRSETRAWNGDEILEKLNSFDFGVLSGETIIPVPERPDEYKCFIHKSRFYDLPYWSKLIQRHTLNVMHIEKNVSPELHHLAITPISHSVQAMCFVNDVKFVSLQRDVNRRTQNSGVMVDGNDLTYYGLLLAVVELIYGNMSVVLFKCRWFNTDPSVPRSTKMDYVMLSVNTNSSWYEDEPFILASMAKQVFYFDDPKAGGFWKVLNLMSHRNIWSATTLEGVEEHDDEDDDDADEPYQEPSVSHIHDVETIRVHNRLDFQRSDQFIIVPNASMSQNHANNDFINDEDDSSGDEDEDSNDDDANMIEDANDTEDEDYDGEV